MCKFLQTCLSHFPQLQKKNEYVSQHTIENCSACVNVHNSLTNRGLKVKVWSVINNGWIHGLNRVNQSSSESLQELVRASSSSMLVTLNNV